MQFKLNPITGDIDMVSGNGNYIQKINPVTGKFNLVDDANSYKQIINPLTGNFQLWALSGGGGYIPEQYAVIEYIETTGTQYIVLPYKVNDKTDFSIKYLQTEKTPLNPRQVADVIFGTVSAVPTTNNASKGFIRLIGNSTSTMNRIGVGDGIGTIKEMPEGTYAQLNTWYDIHIKNNYYTINNDDVFSQYEVVRTEGTWKADANLGIGARAGLEGAVTFPSCIKLSSVVIKENGVELYNLVPVIRNDGVAGMFDTVSQTFFTNNGTGDFVAGPTTIPEEYTRDEYFSCPPLPYVGYVGINTGILPKYNMDIQIDYSVYNSSSIYVFGARETGGNQQMTFSGSQNGGTVTSYVGTSYVAAQTGSTRWARIAGQENRYKIITHIDSEPGSANVSFEDLINSRTNNQNLTFTASIFEANIVPMYIGGNGREPEASTSRIHEVDISWTEDEQLNVRVYIPASKGDKHGFYELFTKQFLHY